MTLRTKVPILLLVVTLGFVGLNAVVQQCVIYPRFEAIEREQACSVLDQVVHRLKGETDALSRLCLEWACWGDELHDFLNEPDPAKRQLFLAHYLADATFRNAGLSLVCIYDNKGQVRWGEWHDEHDGGRKLSEIRSTEDWITTPTSLIASINSPESHREGLIQTSRGLAIVAIRPIVTQRFVGPIQGTIVIAQVLDEPEYEEIGHKGEVHFEPLSGLSASGKATTAPAVDPCVQPASVITRYKDGTLIAEATSNDLNGAPALCMRVELPRRITADGRRAIGMSTLSIVGVGLVLMGCTSLLLQRRIVTPLSRLTAHATSIGDWQAVPAPSRAPRRDEIDILSDEFDRMVVRLTSDTQRREIIEANLRANEAQFRTLVDNIPGAVYRCKLDANWTMLFISESVEDMCGHRAQAFLDGLGYAEVIHPDDRVMVERVVMAAVDKRQPFTMEYRIVHRDGTVKWVHEQGRAAWNDQGEVQWLDGVIFDITVHRQAVDRLNKLSKAVEQCPVSIVVTDREGTIEYVNPKFTEVTGYTPEEAIGNNPRVLKGGEQPEEFYKSLWETISEGREWHGEFCNRRRNGELFWESACIAPVRGPDGSITHFVAIKEDITAQRRVHDALKSSEEEYRTLVEHLPLGAYRNTPGPEGAFITANPAALRMFGCATSHEILQHKVKEFYVNPEERAHFSALLSQRGSLFRHELRMKKRDGTPIWVAVTARVQRRTDGSVECFHGLLEDITEKKAAQAALKATEERLAMMTGAALDAMIMADPGGAIRFWNPAAERMFGYTANEALGRPLYDMIGAAEGPNLLRRFQHEPHLAGAGRIIELPAVRANGEAFPAELSLAPLRIENAWHCVAIIRDVTERKRAEENLRKAKQEAELINQQLAAATTRANEMAAQANAANQAKSRFLAGMSHEIRTPLNGVMGMIDLLLDGKNDENQQRFCNIAKSSAEMLLGIINDILDLSKIEAGRVQMDATEFDLHALVNDVADTFAVRAAQRQVELVVGLHPDVPPRVVGDPQRLRQVIINLVSNAIKFTDSGQVVMRGTVTQRDAERIRVRFSVKDSGIGITAEQIERLFEPFSQAEASTSRKYGGTGLGLAICKRLVQLMGGAIGVNSTPGEGSEFWFEVPLDTQVAGPSCCWRLLPELEHLRVLVVDDNQANRDMIVEHLTAWGMSATAASGGMAAMTLLNESLAKNEPYALILIDRDMPEMDGVALAQAIQANRNLFRGPMALLSPLESDMTAADLQQLGFVHRVIKPIRPSHLFDAVITALLGSSSVYRDLTRDVGSCVPDSAPGGSKRVAPPRQPRILVAEDNEVNQIVVTEILRRAGMKCELVTNGADAVERSGRETFDILLMDCQMPVMDGFEATRQIRQREQETGSGHLPIIALTANAIKGDRESCLAAGMDGYISKPVNPPLLLKEIRSRMRATEGTGDCGSGVDTPQSEIKVPVPEGGSGPIEVEDLLHRCMESGDLAIKLLHRFETQVYADLRKLEEAASHQAIADFTRIAHTMKGAAAALAAEDVRRQALVLEQSGRENDLTDVNNQLTRLRREVDKLVQYIPAACTRIHQQQSDRSKEDAAPCKSS